MTPPATQPTDQAATNQAAADAVTLVAVSYLAEVRGRPLTRRQRDLQARAERLARHWTRPTARQQQQKEGVPR